MRCDAISNRKCSTSVRHSFAGIQEVEKAVREVNEIFKDLSLIVSQQGEQARPSVHTAIARRTLKRFCVLITGAD